VLIRRLDAVSDLSGGYPLQDGRPNCLAAELLGGLTRPRAEQAKPVVKLSQCSNFIRRLLSASRVTSVAPGGEARPNLPRKPRSSGQAVGAPPCRRKRPHSGCELDSSRSGSMPRQNVNSETENDGWRSSSKNRTQALHSRKSSLSAVLRQV
jgi:hypothetical protein